MRALLVVLLLLASAVPASARPLDQAGDGGGLGWWDWTTIVPGKIGLGGGELTSSEVEYLAGEGFRAVLSVREEHEDPVETLAANDMTYLRIPLGDAEHDTLDVAEMQQALDFIDASIAEGRPVYVHCHAGWHRSSAVIAAWLMVNDGTDADTAWEKLEDMREKAEPRWIDAVYAYEAHVKGLPKLEVDVRVPAISPHVGDVIDMVAVVTLGGVPYEGAEVHLEADYDDIERQVVTGPDGRANLTFVFDGTKRQYVHALARAPGLVPGYDRATMYGDRSREERGPFTFTVGTNATEVAPGSNVTLRFQAENTKSDPYNVRVTVGDGNRTLWRGYLGRAGEGEVTVPAASAPGEHVLVVRATSPYADTVVEEVRYTVEGAEPAPADEPAPGDDAAPADPEPEAAVGPAPPRDAPGAGALALVVAVGALALVRRRRA